MYNPIRRNRNIGTVKQGHGKKNKMVIPGPFRPDYKVYWEDLKTPVRIWRKIHGKDLLFLVEEPTRGFAHSSTIDDVEAIFLLMAPEDVRLIDIIVFRQPTRKQKLLEPHWGRLAYFYEDGKAQGAAIIIEAIILNDKIAWGKSIRPQDEKELERLKQDGHNVSFDGGRFTVETNFEACRNTQLYRTLPHEIGHMVDFFESMEKDESMNKTKHDKEAFAHGYADDFAKKAKMAGQIPFPRVFKIDTYERTGLNEEWFKNSP